MIASLLICHYIKHGMTCGLGMEGAICMLALIGICAFAAIGVRLAARDDHKGAG